VEPCTGRPLSQPPDGLCQLPRSKAGYSLLEMLIVLVIMATAIAVVMPSGQVMLDRMITHAVFFDFQRQLSDLRREAYASQTALTIQGSAPVNTQNGRPDETTRVIPLRTAWTYALTQPIRISEGGACTPTAAQILNRGRVVMDLTMTDSACHFIRLD
jgi:prepilin-type N-terminal cleavage/methylation domain-containing protein